MCDRPRVSIIVATHNRRDALMATLSAVAECGLAAKDYETIVVDNASTDGTADAIAALPGVRVIRLRRNRGSCAKSVGVEAARGGLLLFLDDDSFPRAGCLDNMIRRFEADSRLGAAGFSVFLPDGSQECSALPHVFVGCGVGFRARALREVGGLDPTFFMQAEEYDLSFRLLDAKWKVEIFADLQVDHLKTPAARQTSRTTYYDVRNNLRVVARYLPPPYRAIYQQDWLERYAWLARLSGQTSAYRRGVLSGHWTAMRERSAYRTRRLSATTLEKVFRWSFIRDRMNRIRHNGLRRIVLADLGKNIYAFFRGAQEAGLTVLAVADDRLAADGRAYRGIPVISTEKALATRPDAFVVSNTSYVHAELRSWELSSLTSKPVYNWFKAHRLNRPCPSPVDKTWSAATGFLTTGKPSALDGAGDAQCEISSTASALASDVLPLGDFDRSILVDRDQPDKILCTRG